MYVVLSHKYVYTAQCEVLFCFIVYSFSDRWQMTATNLLLFSFLTIIFMAVAAAQLKDVCRQTNLLTVRHNVDTVWVHLHCAQRTSYRYPNDKSVCVCAIYINLLIYCDFRQIK